MFSSFTKTFGEVIDKHTPLKSRKVRGNQSPFITKELSKVIMNKSKPRNKYYKYPSRENFSGMKRAKNYCNNLGFDNNKGFWDTVKPFLINRGFLTNDKLAMKIEDDSFTGKAKFNSDYINIVENTSGIPPIIQGNRQQK